MKAVSEHLQLVGRKVQLMDEQIIIQMLDEEIAKLEQVTPKGLLKLNGKVVAAIKKTAVLKRLARKPKKRVTDFPPLNGFAWLR